METLGVMRESPLSALVGVQNIRQMDFLQEVVAAVDIYQDKEFLVVAAEMEELILESKEDAAQEQEAAVAHMSMIQERL